MIQKMMNMAKRKKIKYLKDFSAIENRLDVCGFTKEEEHKYFEEVLRNIYARPRFYLDNLENLPVFRVSFIDYTTKKKSFINKK